MGLNQHPSDVDERNDTEGHADVLIKFVLLFLYVMSLGLEFLFGYCLRRWRFAKVLELVVEGTVYVQSH